MSEGEKEGKATRAEAVCRYGMPWWDDSGVMIMEAFRSIFFRAVEHHGKRSGCAASQWNLTEQGPTVERI